MKKYRGNPNKVSQGPTAQSMNIFDALKSESIHLRVVVHDWLKLYKQDETEALTDLLDFVLQSCGLKAHTITTQDLEKHEMEELISKIQSHGEETQDYPLMGNQKVFKNFFLNFQFFWVHFVTMANELLYDEVLLSFVINWMTNLSCSKFRPIRHTSTAALLAVGQAIIDVLNVEIKDAERVKTFISTEAQKESGQRLERLKEQEKEIEFRVQTLKDVIDTMLNDVLAHRCKDIMSEIRSLCVQYLGSLVTKCAEQYLNEKVLGCMGLMLYDKVGDVREHALDYLSRIYSSGDENFNRLKPFTEKHLLRLVEMCHDVENKCCALALKLCTVLVKRKAMEQTHVSILCYLLWAESDDIRNAAGDFVTLAMFQDMLPREGESGSELDKGRQIDAERVILSLVSFFKTYGDKQLFRVKLLLQCFWEKTPALKRWEVVCELLQRGEKQNATHLDEEDQNILIHILIFSLDFVRGSEKLPQKSQFQTLSTLLFQRLPPILSLFKQSTVLMSSLVTLIPALDLMAIASKDIRGSVTHLIGALKLIFLQASNPELIMKLGRAFDHLCSSAHPLQKEAKEQLTHIIDEVTRETNETLKAYILEDRNEDVLDTWLCRTASLLAIQDIVDEIGDIPFKDMSAIVSRYRAETVKSVQMAKSCLLVLFYSHLWHLGRIGRQPKLLESYLTYRDLAIDQFAATLESKTAEESVRRLAFKLLCETIMLNSGQAAQGASIYYAVGGDLVRVLCEFIEIMDVQLEPARRLNPPGAFVKLSAKTDSTHEDADENSQEMCILLARLICNCPSVTVSQLPSSLLALFGTCNFRSVSALVKQIINFLKTKDLQQSGIFKDNGNYFSILLDSMMKAFGDRKKDSLSRVKDLSRRLSALQGNGPLKPKQAERLKDMIYEGISFSLSCHENFVFLEALTSFLNKSFMTPVQMQEIFERVTKDLQKMHDIVNQEAPGRLDLLLPLTNFHAMLARLSGNRVELMTSSASRKPKIKGLEGPKSQEPEPVVMGRVKADDEPEEQETKKTHSEKTRETSSRLRVHRKKEEMTIEESLPRVRKAARKSAQKPEDFGYIPPIIKEEEDGSLVIQAFMKPPKVDFQPITPLAPTSPDDEKPEIDQFPPQKIKKAARKTVLPDPIPESMVLDSEAESDTLEIFSAPTDQEMRNDVKYSVSVNPETFAITFSSGKREVRESIYEMDEEDEEEPSGKSRRAAVRRRLLEM